MSLCHLNGCISIIGMQSYLCYIYVQIYICPLICRFDRCHYSGPMDFCDLPFMKVTLLALMATTTITYLCLCLWTLDVWKKN